MLIVLLQKAVTARKRQETVDSFPPAKLPCPYRVLARLDANATTLFSKKDMTA